MIDRDIQLRKANGGYIVTTRDHENVFTDLEGVFKYLLQLYEGLAPTFSGSLHGEVTIKRGAA